MKVLDLFCGLGGWSKAFHEAGHECFGVDIKNYGYKYGKFIEADLNDWTPGPELKFDIILASPPCTQFCIFKKHFHGNQDERIGLDLVYRTYYLIELIKPKYWVIENVKGLAEFIDKPNEIIAYNRHKDGKKAFLWSNIGKLGFLDKMIMYRARTANKYKKYKKLNPNYKKPLNKTTTCKSKADLGLIPYPLSKAVLDKINSM